jgi:lipoate-protein ligase A
MSSDRIFERAEWRLVFTPPAPGAWNMAVDETLLESVYHQVSPPTLRLYAWEPPCLSLGYAQPIQDVDQGRLQQHGWELVRRPTGGRAILHTDELTYSITAPETEPRLAGGVLESYLRLSTALVQALQQMELNVQTKELDPNNHTHPAAGPVCFEVPSNYEITVNGKKLVGSAQARKKEGILQHGTLPLTGDLARITQGLVFDSEAQRTAAAQILLERATTVASVLGKEINWQAAADAFVLGFQSALNLSFTQSPLTPQELDRARQLTQEKYGRSDWTARV